MTTVAITGVSGYLGQLLMARLENDEQVGRLIGIDIVAPERRSPKLRFSLTDIRSPRLADVLSGADVVVHLAALVSTRNADEMSDTNVHGTGNVFRTAQGVGAQRVVYTSSILAYGAHPDNPIPLHEDAPLRPEPTLPYTVHKAATEAMAAAFRDQHPEIAMTVLRPTFIIGPNAKRPMARLARYPLVPGVRGCDPPFQFVHEHDVIEALVAAIDGRLTGTFNVSPSDSLPLSVLAELGRRRRLWLTPRSAGALARTMWRLRVVDLAPGWVRWLRYPCVVASDRLIATGFGLKHTTESAFLESLRPR